MIAKGNLHGHGQKLAAYLVRGDKGDRAELVEMRGFGENDLRAAFRSVEIYLPFPTISASDYSRIQIPTLTKFPMLPAVPCPVHRFPKRHQLRPFVMVADRLSRARCASCR